MILGATSVEQLGTDIAASLTALPAEALEAVDRVQHLYPDPCP